jgi:hypothetical protein
MGLLIKSVAWTGIAAILLIDGQTLHSLFKLPLDLSESANCDINFKSKAAHELYDTQIIVWDEAPMASIHAFNAIDLFFRALMKIDKPFGGKIMVLGGDFRQATPVVSHTTETVICENSIKISSLWKVFKSIKLTINMRTGIYEKKFSEWLLRLGDGLLNLPNSDIIHVPQECITNGDLIDEIYRSFDDIDLKDKCILCPTNEDVEKLNEEILNYLSSDSIKTYISIDSIFSDESNTSDNINYPVEFLNSLRLPSLPPHKLNLKKGSIIMLLKNLKFKHGLCNGTRLKVIEMKSYLIKAEILTENFVGSHALIPRIQNKS